MALSMMLSLSQWLLCGKGYFLVSIDMVRFFIWFYS